MIKILDEINEDSITIKIFAHKGIQGEVCENVNGTYSLKWNGKQYKRVPDGLTIAGKMDRGYCNGKGEYSSFTEVERQFLYELKNMLGGSPKTMAQLEEEGKDDIRIRLC